MSEEIIHFDKPHFELDEFVISQQTFELQPRPAKLCLVLLSRTSGYGTEQPREDHWHLSPDYVKGFIVGLEQQLRDFE